MKPAGVIQIPDELKYAAAALTRSGPDEALSHLDEQAPGVGLDAGLRAVECGAHPATAELAEALTAFLASGATRRHRHRRSSSRSP